MSALTDIIQDPSVPGYPSCNLGKKSCGPPAHTPVSHNMVLRKRMLHIAATWAGLICRRAYPDLNQGAGLFSILRTVISWFSDVGSKSGPPFRGSSESVLGTFGLVPSVSGLSLAARTSSAECVEALEAFVPRFATGVLDGEIGAHLTRAAVDAHVSVSVIVPGYTCVFLCTSAVWEKEFRARRSLGGSNSRT